MRTLRTALAFLLLFSGSAAEAAAWRGSTDQPFFRTLRRGLPIQIRRGDGGDLDVHADLMAYIVRRGQRIIIDGPCYSACTLFLELPAANVCWTRRATFHYHAATERHGKQGAWRLSAEGNRFFIQRVNAHITEWAHGVHVFESTRFRTAPSALIESVYGEKRCP